MIQLVGVHKRFGHTLLFEDLSWHIRRGERIGLVGPNGAGKTTLLEILVGRQEPDLGRVVRTKGVTVGLLAQEQDFSAGRSVLDEVEKATEELREVTHELRDLEARLGGADARTLERYGALRDRFEALGGYTAEAEARRVLCGLGFKNEELLQPASRFSGGWRMRIALARLLLQSPDVLLLDEPTNHLDLESLQWFEDYLAAYDGTVVVVSHDRYFLNRTVERIADLRPDGVRQYKGGYDAFIQQWEEEAAQREKQAARQDAEIAKTERFIERFRSKNTKAKQVQSRVKALEKIEKVQLLERVKAVRGFRFPQPPRTGRTVVELRDLHHAYGDIPVYRGLNLVIERGQRIALVGPNGAGKSTLLKLLAGAITQQGGELVLGHQVTVGYFAQHQLEALTAGRSVLEEMTEAADIATYPLVRGLLGAFLFSGDDVAKPVEVLSGGEKARLALCRILLRPVSLLMMDEPTNHLDLSSRETLEDALRRYEGTLVVVSHDRYFINAVCDHIFEVVSGEVRCFPGNYDDYLWKKAQEEQAAAPAVTPGGRTVAGGAAEPSEEDRRARKRREAEERKRIHQATHRLKAELEALEPQIEAAEARVAAIDEELADPASYTRDGHVPALIAERATLQASVAELYARWEALDASIAEASARALDV